MAKQIALLEYTMIFNPAETWSNGFQFEKLFADFFAYYGFEAQIVAANGGTGRRVIYIERKTSVQQVARNVPQPKQGVSAQQQIKQAQAQTPTKSFKQFQPRGVPKSFTDQEKRQPKPTFSNAGPQNRTRIKS